MSQTKGIPSDYDTNPERFRANVQAVEQYGLAQDVHEEVADRLAAENLTPILDLGCGEGRLTKPLHQRGLPTVAFDYSATMLVAVPDPRVRGNANHLPFYDHSFRGVAALYMLYHLDEPRKAIAESYRVLQSGGLFVASAPSRHNDPELIEVLGPPAPETFDAENGPTLVADYFEKIEVERWDAPLVHLPDREALKLYLEGRQLAQHEVDEVLGKINPPLRLTKRGALIYGRKS
ncbi:class I SAM-dependent methyltransferase [Chloroflexi bacterium TSY]|nr:class I SAM-dependent methyltransferase [Chloroflexi bacterium TSY]